MRSSRTAARANAAINQRGFNVWKWLFIGISAVFAVYAYFFHFRSSTSSAAQPVKSTLMALEPVKLVNFTPTDGKPVVGVINGRIYSIYNTTNNIPSLLHSFDGFRASKYAKPSHFIKDYGPKKVNKLRFLHVPKAGKAFASVMIHYCCTLLDEYEVDPTMPFVLKQYQPWRFDPTCRSCLHQPVSGNGDYFAHFPFITGVDEGHTVFLLRKPLDRLAFHIDQMRGLLGLMVAFGMTESRAQQLGKILSGRIADGLTSIFNIPTLYPSMDLTKFIAHPWSALFVSKASECIAVSLNKTSNPSKFEACRWQLAALFPGIQGCQTRMIIGRNCIDELPMTDADLSAAKQRLSDGSILFAGLYERWNESVSLFHSINGGKMFVDELRLPFKPPKLEEKKILLALNQGDAIHDPYDEALYEYGKAMFEKSLKSIVDKLSGD